MCTTKAQNNFQKKIKLLQLGNAGELYGAERWILALIKYLEPSHVKTWVASIRDEPSLRAPLCLEAERMGFPVKIFDFYGKYNFPVIRHLKKFIIENEIDIIHTHHYKTDLIGLLATKGTSCKCVSTPHGWTKNPDFKLLCYETINRFIFPFFDAVVPLSQDILEPLCLIPGLKNKLYLIENGVDIREIEDINCVATEINSLKKNGNFIIGYIGRLISAKGLDILFKAVADLAEPNWHVVVIGEGERKQDLISMTIELKIKDKVTFLGFKSDRLSYLKGFDVFVLPSKSEGTPRCLMEAMAAGIPVIASNIPGCRNLVDGKTTGLLFQSGNTYDLAESLKRLSIDSKLRNNLSRKGQQYIKENFSSVVMARRYQNLFTKLCYGADPADFFEEN